MQSRVLESLEGFIRWLIQNYNVKYNKSAQNEEMLIFDSVSSRNKIIQIIQGFADLPKKLREV